MFIKTKRDGRTVFYREQYNLVTYNTTTNTNAVSYLEGIAQDPVGIPNVISTQEMYDDIMVCECPPWPGCRIGQQPAS